MFRNLSNRFANGTVMILKKQEDGTVEFIGSGFLCHSKGYIMTCAHLFSLAEKVVMAGTEPINN